GHRQDPPRPGGRRRARGGQLPGGRPPGLARQRGPPRLSPAVPRLPLLVDGEAAAAEQRRARPFHLCLDEMNLARPEHYLAELLSKMEVSGGRVTFHTGGDEAGFPSELCYPANLVIIGTVNLDETTLPISTKILDRSAYLVVE